MYIHGGSSVSFVTCDIHVRTSARLPSGYQHCQHMQGGGYILSYDVLPHILHGARAYKIGFDNDLVPTMEDGMVSTRHHGLQYCMRACSFWTHPRRGSSPGTHANTSKVPTLALGVGDGRLIGGVKQWCRGGFNSLFAAPCLRVGLASGGQTPEGDGCTLRPQGQVTNRVLQHRVPSNHSFKTPAHVPLPKPTTPSHMVASC